LRSRGYIAALLICFSILSLTSSVFASDSKIGTEPEIKYLKSTSFDLIYLEGERSSIPGIKAAQHSLIYNNNGIEPEEGLSAYLAFDLEWGSAPVSLHLTPLFSMEGGEGTGEFQKAFVKLSFLGLDLDLGKRELWWGAAKHGSLFLTNNAEPLTMVRLTNPDAVTLPWLFKYLGPFRFDSFVTRLAHNRDIPEPYFAGLRFIIKPHRIVEVGLTRTFIFGGKGRPEVSLERLFEIAFGENGEGNGDLSNSLAGVDLKITLPLFEAYLEWGGEDEAGGLPSGHAYILGLYVPEFMSGLDFRIEYADLTFVGTPPPWYKHGLYTSGYTYKGRILGHHAGGGGRDIFIEMGIINREKLNGRVMFDYEDRGVNIQAVTEEHYQLGSEWKYQLGGAMAGWRADIGLAYERVKNAGYTLGPNRDNWLVNIGITGAL
jgi:hypothetical protein